VDLAEKEALAVDSEVLDPEALARTSVVEDLSTGDHTAMLGIGQAAGQSHGVTDHAVASTHRGHTRPSTVAFQSTQYGRDQTSASHQATSPHHHVPSTRPGIRTTTAATSHGSTSHHHLYRQSPSVLRTRQLLLSAASTLRSR